MEIFIHGEEIIWDDKLLDNHITKKIIIFLKKPTTVQICRLENIEHKNMKQVSYSGKYSSQLVELINLIYNSLLQLGCFLYDN